MIQSAGGFEIYAKFEHHSVSAEFNEGFEWYVIGIKQANMSLQKFQNDLEGIRKTVQS